MTEATKPRSIVLVGPTNVGKSTLFNKLTHTRAAIVCDRPGVTIDRHELTVKNSPVGLVRIVDTGGVGLSLKEHPIGREIERAAAEAVQEADLILFVVDGTQDAGIEEFEVATWLRKQKKIDNKAIWIIANKSDARRFSESSYHALGFDRVLAVSAEHGHGTPELWEQIDAFFGGHEEVPEEAPVPRQERLPAIVVLGRPNVGKSTLLNTIIGKERHVVSETAGTTRDVIESRFVRHGMEWRLLDTAGVRRPGRLERDVEWVARQKLEDAARTASLALLVIDSTEGVTDLDAAIAGMAQDFGLSLVLVFNKWDRMKGDELHDQLMKLERTKDLKMDFLHWCPVVRLSGLTGKGLSELMKTIDSVLEGRTTRVQTSMLNRLFEAKLRHHSHPSGQGGKPAKFYYLAQFKDSPPEFALFSNMQASNIHFSYKRYLMNCLREEFGFKGTPIRLHFKTSRKPAP
ncbi:MAG: ribosome biogenesis GTPase Der [Bdellovibrionales bacterium]|nr:ribosome biogenesis GTPase Der [Bdellovibrionales bacterium]